MATYEDIFSKGELPIDNQLLTHLQSDDTVI